PRLPRLFDDREAAVIVGRAWRVLDLDHPLAEALGPELCHAGVAERHVAALAEERVGRPGAAGLARLGVVAGGAVPPELAGVAIAREAHALGALPHVGERHLAHVACAVALGR